MPRQMTERIAITDTTKKKLKAFQEGMGGKSYDEAIQLLLELATLEGEDARGSGTEIGYARKRGLTIKHVSIEQK